MGKKLKRFDAGESARFLRDLEYIKTQSYDVKHVAIKNRQLIPVSFEADNTADTITYYQFDGVGMAKVIADYSRDFRAVDIKGREFTSRVLPIGASYEYSFQEIRKALKTGQSVPARKAMYARRAVMEREQNIAYEGEAGYDIFGLYNQPNVPLVVMPHPGAFDTLTPTQILENLGAVANNPIRISNGVETPDTMLLDIETYTYIAETARSTTSDTTILDFFLQKNPFIMSVDWVAQASRMGAEDANGDATSRIVAYRRDPLALTLEIPQDYETLPIDDRGTVVKIPVHLRTGGVLVYYPLSMSYADIV